MPDTVEYTCNVESLIVDSERGCPHHNFQSSENLQERSSQWRLGPRTSIRNNVLFSPDQRKKIKEYTSEVLQRPHHHWSPIVETPNCINLDSDYFMKEKATRRTTLLCGIPLQGLQSGKHVTFNFVPTHDSPFVFLLL